MTRAVTSYRHMSSRSPRARSPHWPQLVDRALAGPGREHLVVVTSARSHDGEAVRIAPRHPLELHPAVVRGRPFQAYDAGNVGESLDELTRYSVARPIRVVDDQSQLRGRLRGRLNVFEKSRPSCGEEYAARSGVIGTDRTGRARDGTSSRVLSSVHHRDGHSAGSRGLRLLRHRDARSSKVSRGKTHAAPAASRRARPVTHPPSMRKAHVPADRSEIDRKGVVRVEERRHAHVQAGPPTPASSPRRVFAWSPSGLAQVPSARC